MSPRLLFVARCIRGVFWPSLARSPEYALSFWHIDFLRAEIGIQPDFCHGAIR
jgi:hypothetical protein